MLFTLSEIVDFLIDPGNLMVFLLALGALSLAFGWHRLGGTLVGIVAVAGVAIMVLPVLDWVSGPLENRFPRPELPAHVDGIVVLGGAIRVELSENRGEVALNSMAERMTETMALARRYPGVPVLVSGGGKSADGRLTEAAAMRTLLVEDGIDAGRIVMEDRSSNTWENALYSKQVAHPAPGQVWVLVTSANHMPRAVGCFREVGFPVLPYPVDYNTAEPGTPGAAFGFDSGDFDFARNLEALNEAVHEWSGLVAYRLLGRTDALFPGPSN